MSRVIAILKAYSTRVGEGPFPTELFDDDGEPGSASYGPRQEYEDQVRVEDYDPDTQSITVVDPASHQQVRLDSATGVMDVTDLRTGRTRSYDDPEHDWIADDPEDPRG